MVQEGRWECRYRNRGKAGEGRGGALSSHTAWSASGQLCRAARDLKEVGEVDTVVRVIHLYAAD